MTYQGIDTVERISAESAKKLRENGVSFVARYLVPERYDKALTVDEAATLRDAGLAVMLCWETSAKRMLGGATAGAQDGKIAKELAEQLGVPIDTVIYFAADFDAQESDLPQIESYLRAARVSCAPYQVGVYGGQRTIEHAASYCSFLWQCCAWSKAFSTKAFVHQYAWQNSTAAKNLASKVGIVAVDLDRASMLEGMWRPSESGAIQWARANDIKLDDETPTKRWLVELAYKIKEDLKK